MSCIRINLIDFNETVSGEVHGGIGNALIASLSAEPETIGELESGLARFIKPIHDHSLLRWLRPRQSFVPYDAGLIIIDLTARMVMIDSTYSAPEKISECADDVSDQQTSITEPEDFLAGEQTDQPVARPARRRPQPQTFQIRYHNGEHSTDFYLPYRLPDDWLFVSSVSEYENARTERAITRRQIEWLDARKVLFGEPLCRFLAEAVSSVADFEADDLLSEIHARWLTTKRDDLEGHSPREVLLERMEFIDFDLHSRQLQWSFTGECPPALLPNSHAYRFGGFGTHEIVVYYDLIRALLSASVARARAGKKDTVENEIDQLIQIRNNWLETATDEYQNKAPALVIEWERRRIPMAISGREAMVSDDCPICQAMADDIEGPFFWHLDGSAMDDRFEFSFHKNREDFDAEQQEWKEFNRKYQEKNVFDKSMTVRMGQ